ncbi:alpha/beta hydrolase-fold protein [Spiroplasma platyhelix]|uniref:Esterase n=1 Tax=Spiroplasma platyhelix PALS-1 TaxID=1276218 RepID=A0A846U076_9MOLU|nr:alpha/beta hydrolase-fold protein [Spiroplasma platyhelix]MBE4703873.1 hypothetical protein [Spiroplasma platyhelix PALS-1]NKE38246.1 hypothetical protein [Spiroplasma platyhelix PALS-1]UJB29131.1 hypothetical protein SPLAT_v1c03670 [Spiroplasma platyhelix PALS-1]
MNYILEDITLKNQTINLAVPKDFNSTQKYSLYLVFDGQQLLTNSESNILANNQTNKIFIGLNSSNDATRFNNLAAYHNRTVKSLMTKYFPELKDITNDYLGGQGQATINFITKDLLPWLTSQKSIQIADLNLLGCSMGAYLSLQMLYLSNLTFKKAYLFSASIWFNEAILNDLKTKALNNNSSLTVNLWVGLKEPKSFEKTIATNYYQDALNVKSILTSHQQIKVNFFVEKNGAHGFKWWINFLNNHQELY